MYKYKLHGYICLNVLNIFFIAPEAFKYITREKGKSTKKVEVTVNRFKLREENKTTKLRM